MVSLRSALKNMAEKAKEEAEASLTAQEWILAHGEEKARKGRPQARTKMIAGTQVHLPNESGRARKQRSDLITALQEPVLTAALASARRDYLEILHVVEAPISIKAVKAFMDNLNTRTERVNIEFAWHGTPLHNRPGIYSKGLVMGGTKGVRVSNGTALGQGVYVGLQASTSISYTRRTPQAAYHLLACAVIPGAPQTNRGTMRAIHAQNHVLPVFEIVVRHSCNNHYPMPPPPTISQGRAVTTVKVKLRNASTPYYEPLALLSKAKSVKARQKQAALDRQRRAERQPDLVIAGDDPNVVEEYYGFDF